MVITEPLHVAIYQTNCEIKTSIHAIVAKVADACSSMKKMQGCMRLRIFPTLLPYFLACHPISNIIFFFGVYRLICKTPSMPL